MKPTFTYRFVNNNVAPCTVEFISTAKLPEEEIYLFDFKDGHLYSPDPGEEYPIQSVRHMYKTPGKYGVTAMAVDRVTTSDPVVVTIVSTPEPLPEPPEPPEPESLWARFIKWLYQLLGL